jgi:diguanylate cyclase (GGDEF)-like protein
MSQDAGELRQFRAFLQASEGILQASTLQDKLRVIADSVVESGLFRRCLVSVYQHELTDAVMVGGAGVLGHELAGLRRGPSLTRDQVRALEQRGVHLGEHCYYIPARFVADHPATLRSHLPREAFVDWHPDDMFLATLRSRDGQLFGFLTADDPEDGKIPTPDSVRTLTLFANLASDLLEREFALRRDSLTHMYNGAFLEEILAELDERPRPPFSALFADLDNLKWVNDRFGHRIGDQYILAAGRIVTLAVGAGVITFRPYGDEFVAITREPGGLDGAPERVAEAVAVWNASERQRLLGRVLRHDRPEYRLGMSAGTACRDDPEEAARAVVIRAEQGMYERKRTQHARDGRSSNDPAGDGRQR